VGRENKHSDEQRSMSYSKGVREVNKSASLEESTEMM
jgi:hypothetical protein